MYKLGSSTVATSETSNAKLYYNLDNKLNLAIRVGILLCYTNHAV